MPNAKTRRAATRRPARTRSVPAPVQAFPVDIVIPLDLGKNPRRLALPKPCEAAAAESARPAKKKRTAAKGKKKPAVQRRKAATKPRAWKPLAKPLATPAVIALPHLPEPLVESEAAIDLATWLALAPPQSAPEPLPRSRAPALHRSGGLIGALADWIGARTQQLWRTISRLDRQRPRFRPSLPLRRSAQDAAELAKLKAENERLRLQLEALMALQTGAAERATIPQP
jgi:hypothetical protein